MEIEARQGTRRRAGEDGECALAADAAGTVAEVSEVVERFGGGAVRRTSRSGRSGRGCHGQAEQQLTLWIRVAKLFRLGRIAGGLALRKGGTCCGARPSRWTRSSVQKRCWRCRCNTGRWRGRDRAGWDAMAATGVKMRRDEWIITAWRGGNMSVPEASGLRVDDAVVHHGGPVMRGVRGRVGGIKATATKVRQAIRANGSFASRRRAEQMRTADQTQPGVGAWGGGFR